MEFTVSGGKDALVRIENQKEVNGFITFDVAVNYETPTVPDPVKIRFSFPVLDCYSTWSPSVRFSRQLQPNWRKQVTHSRLASWMPVHTLVSAKGQNRMTVALSDALTPTSIETGVLEETACFDCAITFFTVQIAAMTEYRATVRIDLRDIPYYESIAAVTEWWETDCGYTPAYVPEAAKMPMNSLWYTYHQDLDVEDILQECRLSKALGMDTVIIDDGWQTDDSNRGYGHCGDWEVAKSKIPDMKQFVHRIHETGMKVMLWYSVPFIGIYSKKYAEFKNMLLDGTGRNDEWWAVDPRYPEVRQFLIQTYTNALQEWELDGLKLDFIDSFKLQGASLKYDEKRDYQSLEDAIDRLMTDVTDALRKIDPEVLIEFRQSYVGPAIRKYGNMLRVCDCPDDAIVNRLDVVNLRLTSGKTAVHSDMLMWNYGEPVESAALQLVSALYSVPQISVKIAKLNEEHKKMLTHFLAFWREHRDTLINGTFAADNPESAYSSVRAKKEDETIVTVYTNPVIYCNNQTVIAVNGSASRSLILKNGDGKTYRTVDCMGNLLQRGTVCGNLWEIDVPMAGMLFVTEEKH